MDPVTHHKELFAPWRAALYDFDLVGARAALHRLCDADVVFNLSFPFETIHGVDAFFDRVFVPLAAAFEGLEARDYIRVGGPTDEGAHWVGCAGSILGRFCQPWLDIPASGHLAHMRYHEFYRFEGGKVVEVQALWDLPELMMQAQAWPMAPGLGRHWHVPGPATQDGLRPGPYVPETSQDSCRHVLEMLEFLVKHPSEGGPEVMQADRFWHPNMNWYGPAGIGSSRGFDAFRNWHQIPFLAAMPDRGQYPDEAHFHFFGDGPYVAVTGWPNMVQTLTGDGWMGIAPAGAKISLRSLDFWRIENGLIRENWVLVDLLSLYDQIGVDVFARMREFNKARIGFDPQTGRSL
ncbi:ester cyclase [Ascidiaceihabitans sp.]|uniref:ester cyclase n=1 Tax=Ascidiaceihabitans sp. TaxID=1872644 RepID=UPI0032991D43